MSVQIIVDSGTDMEPVLSIDYHLDTIPLKTYFGENEYLDNVTLSHDEFFHRLIETDMFPTTSQITPYEYQNHFQRAVDAGDTVVCLTISSRLSGCYQSACLAASEFPDKVRVVDTENACVGERVLAELAVSLRDEGKTMDEIADILDREKKKVRVIALLDTLEYLKKGGRISAAVAFAGTVFSIKPVIAIEDGEVVMLGKARGSRAGNNLLSELILKEGGIDFNRPCCLAYSGLSDNLLQKYIADNKDLYEGQLNALPVSSIGCVIGTHIGPGAIAAAFFVKQ